MEHVSHWLNATCKHAPVPAPFLTGLGQTPSLAADRTWYQLVSGLPGRRLQDTKFVAVWISEDVPAPSVFAHGVIGEQGRAEAEDPLDLPLKVGGTRVQMQPVLVVLVIAGALQEYLDAVAVRGDQCRASCSPGPPGIRADWPRTAPTGQGRSSRSR